MRIEDDTKPLTIFSVYRSERSEAENQALHLGAMLALRIAGAEYSQLDGCYKGVRERSLMVIAPTWEQSHLIRQLAERHEQESIMLVSPTRAASLWYVVSGRHEHIGQLTAVPKAEAMLADAWSRNSNGHYYVVR